jgi:hypothetical protein
VAGVTAIDCKTAFVTVNVVPPLTEPTVAVMTEDPADTPVTTPVTLTVAFAGVALDQTALLMTALVPFEYVPVATSACVNRLLKYPVRSVHAKRPHPLLKHRH